MTNRSCRPSFERGRWLISAGCPLDYPNALPRDVAAHREILRIRQLDGYAGSRIFCQAFSTEYLIGLKLSTDIPSGVIISDWSFSLPFVDQLIIWDFEMEDILPKDERGRYEGLFNSSRLSAVLNDHRLLVRGHPVEGFLCGRAYESLPEPLASTAPLTGKLVLITDTGRTFTRRIALGVYRIRASHATPKAKKRVGRLLDNRDPDTVRIKELPPLPPKPTPEQDEEMIRQFAEMYAKTKASLCAQ